MLRLNPSRGLVLQEDGQLHTGLCLASRLPVEGVAVSGPFELGYLARVT
jgi:hypothetical protein